MLSLGKKETKYNFVGNIDAPSGYTGGAVTITITAADGEQRSFSTSSFPVSVNETGFKSGSGTISFSGTRVVESQKIDEAGNPAVDENGDPVMEQKEEKVDYPSQTVNFTQAQ